jgi:hypothetical protein
MSDIVERLRTIAHAKSVSDPSLLHEAADEIERLHALTSDEDVRNKNAALTKEIERLRLRLDDRSITT